MFYISACSECSLGRGTYLFEAPNTCEKFYQCLPNKAYILQDCGAGTLFNKVTGRCEMENDYDCDACEYRNQATVASVLVCGACYSTDE